MYMLDTDVSVAIMRFIFVEPMIMGLELRRKLWRRIAPLRKSVLGNVFSLINGIYTICSMMIRILNLISLISFLCYYVFVCVCVCLSTIPFTKKFMIGLI